MKSPSIIEKVALVDFRDNKVIMARSAKNPEVFYMLGGKLEDQETDIECLHREVKEEVNTYIEEGSIHFLKAFEGPAHGKTNTIVRIKVYKGRLVGAPVPSNEIAEVQYFDTTVKPKHLGLISTEILSWLKSEGYIN